MAQIITTACIKGGVGKTTTAAALAQAAAKDGKRVLAIDLDPQGNLTAALNADPIRAGSMELLDGIPVREAAQLTDQGIYVIAARRDLATIKTGTGSAKRLREALVPEEDQYDMILIDTPPQMGELTFNGLMAAKDLIIPLETDRDSLQGLYEIAEIAQQIRHSNPDLKIRGTVLIRYESRSNINRYLKDVISDKGKELGIPFLMAIRAGIAIRESRAMQQSLFDYAPNSNPAKDYRKLYEMIKEN